MVRKKECFVPQPWNCVKNPRSPGSVPLRRMSVNRSYAYYLPTKVQKEMRIIWMLSLFLSINPTRLVDKQIFSIGLYKAKVPPWYAVQWEAWRNWLMQRYDFILNDNRIFTFYSNNLSLSRANHYFCHTNIKLT